MLKYEYSDNIHRYLGQLDHVEVRTLADFTIFSEEHGDLELPTGTPSRVLFGRPLTLLEYPDQNRLLNALHKRPTEKEYREAKEHILKAAHDSILEYLTSISLT